MKLKLVLPLFILLLSITSCSKSPGKTDAGFKLKISALTDLGSAGAGGAMIWGKSDTGEMFGTAVNTSSGLQLELNNGNWTFWAVAWEGNNSVYNFGGKIRCAKSTAALAGTDVQLSMTLSNSNCSNTDFSPAVTTTGGVNQFPDISYRECDKLSDHNGYLCGKGIFGSKASSRRIIMNSFKKEKNGAFVVTGGGLVSECRLGYQGFENEHLPVGNGVLPVFTTLQTFFSSASCDETDPKGMLKEEYELGLNGTNKATSLAFINQGLCNTTNLTVAACESFGGMVTGGVCVSVASLGADISQAACIAGGGTYTIATNKKFVFLSTIPDEVLCSGKRIDPSITSPHIFAGGNGTMGSPLKICNEQQLNSIGGNAAYMNSNFSLHADLDMNKTSVFSAQPLPCTQVEPGINFVPIGGLYDSACVQSANAVPFNGFFNGYNHSIANIRIHGKVNDLGFIRQGGGVGNLVLKNIEVEGKNNVGAFIGKNPATLYNVVVSEGDIRGSNNVGGVTGYSPSAYEFMGLRVKDATVRIDESAAGCAVGGLIGTTDTLSSLILRKSSFEGLIKTQGSACTAGGLIGKTFTLDLYDSYSNGSILNNGNSISGGLVGSTSTGLHIVSSYSRMNIGPTSFDMSNGGNFGGIVGTWAGGASIENSYYYGSIMMPCYKGATINCGVGAISGGSVISNLTRTYGTLLGAEWYTAPPQDLTVAAFDGGTPKTALISTLSYKNSGATYPRLNWEEDICSKLVNNTSVSTQQSTRGSLTNPVVICNKDQWKEIKNYPALNYVIEDNLSLGYITASDAITTFSGSINGKNHLVSFYYYMSSGNMGLIGTNNGRLSNIRFASSYMDINGGSGTSGGVVGTNGTSGKIESNQFLSVNILEGKATYQGVIAGVNSGNIFDNKVDSNVSSLKSAGLFVGQNTATGVIKGARVQGQLELKTTDQTYTFGSVAAMNAGKISEVSTSATVNNPSGGNTSSGTYIGTFVGTSSGIIEDVLIEHYAKLKANAVGPYYGQGFGNLTGSVSRAIVANEVAADSAIGTVEVKSFAGLEAATYVNSYFLSGGVFKYDSTSPKTILTCTNTSNIFSYTLNSTLSMPGGFTDGFYVPSLHENITSRLKGSSLVDGVSSFTLAPGAGDMIVPCGDGGIASSGATVVYPYDDNIADFSGTNVTAADPSMLSAFYTYCPAVNNYTYPASTLATCDLGNGQFDIAYEKAGFFGYKRILNAHQSWIETNQIPTVRPVWIMSEGDAYPRLFIAD